MILFSNCFTYILVSILNNKKKISFVYMIFLGNHLKKIMIIFREHNFYNYYFTIFVYFFFV